jgi:hypothetical protein
MNIEVYRIGVAAVEALGMAAEGRVQGVTSRGAFLRIIDRIIYLTPLDYRSPFNLTLAGGDQRFERLEPGDVFTIDNGRLYFPGKNIRVITEQADAWLPPLPAAIRSTLIEQHARAEAIAQRLRELNPNKGFLFLSQAENDTLTPDQFTVLRAAQEIQASFTRGNRAGFMQAADSLIGSGGGLTPSGDDFLAGFLLYHFRRHLATGAQHDSLSEWCAEVTATAFLKTTTISANRLLFTARGWSEDIFLDLIDHLFDPSIPFPDDKVRLLMDIGHSSGVDTFMGVLYAIQSLQ